MSCFLRLLTCKLNRCEAPAAHEGPICTQAACSCMTSASQVGLIGMQEIYNKEIRQKKRSRTHRQGPHLHAGLKVVDVEALDVDLKGNGAHTWGEATHCAHIACSNILFL